MEQEDNIVVDMDQDEEVIDRPPRGKANVFTNLGPDGKARLMVLFPTGEPKVIATED